MTTLESSRIIHLATGHKWLSDTLAPGRQLPFSITIHQVLLHFIPWTSNVRQDLIIFCDLDQFMERAVSKVGGENDLCYQQNRNTLFYGRDLNSIEDQVSMAASDREGILKRLVTILRLE